MRKLLLKLLFPKSHRYDFWFMEEDKKRYFHVISPYKLDTANAQDFAKAINEVVEIYKPYSEETLGRIKYIFNKANTVSQEARDKMRESIKGGKDFVVKTGGQKTTVVSTAGMSDLDLKNILDRMNNPD